jgi:CRISPR-associated protein Cmr2
MGATIEAIQSVERHRALSGALSEFAQGARRIVEGEARGELVLAGGDDILAFVPLHRAVDAARRLAEDFARRLAPFARAGAAAPTLSVGIGIAHFLEPLGRALDLARDAEREAKRERGSLAVALDKRSGPPLAVVGRWGDLDRTLDDFVTLHVEDRIPDGMAFELRELARLLIDAPAGDRPALGKVVSKEAERILRRKQPGHGEESALAPGDLQALEELYGRLSGQLGVEALSAFADRLVLARVIAEAKQQATAPAPLPKEAP